MIVGFTNSIFLDVDCSEALKQTSKDHGISVLSSRLTHVALHITVNHDSVNLVDVADSKLKNRPIARCYPTPRDKKAKIVRVFSFN